MFGETWSEYFRFIRFAWVLFLIAVVGRLTLGALDVPYEKGTWFFSIVTLTAYLAILYGAFSKKWKGYRARQAFLLGALIGASGQILILVLTLASYGFGIDTYFNHPTALNASEAISLGAALPARLEGLLFNTIASGIVCILGWLGGGLIPDPK